MGNVRRSRVGSRPVRRDFDVTAIPREANWFGTFDQTSHSGPVDYLQEVPLLFYGRGFIKSLGRTSVDREVTLADVAPTQARLLGFDAFDRDGTPLEEVLKPSSRRPRLLVTVVIDGGGWIALEETEGSWPHLASLLEKGANVDGAVVGSSPSITPAVHTTLSTGTWPYKHGVMAVISRSDEGALVGGFSKVPYEMNETKADPTVNLETTTLADEWDLETNNKAKVAMIAAQNFHLGMAGNGAALPGGDKDIVALTQGRRWRTNTSFYSLPEYANSDRAGLRKDLHKLDLKDGVSDGLWRGHGYKTLYATPAYSFWETRLLESIATREDFGRDDVTDLIYINYKSPDSAGHGWNMTSPEERDAMASVDQSLEKLVSFLDDRVGPRRYVLTITADHGQTPLGGSGWPINQAELADDIDEHFDHIANDTGVVENTSATLYFMNKAEMEANGVTPEQVSEFIGRYTIGQNNPEDKPVPKGFEERLDEELFVAALPGRLIDDMQRCAGRLK